MFTHKQAWRRQTHRQRDRNRSSLKSSSALFNRSSSLPEASDEPKVDETPTNRQRRNTVDLGVVARHGKKVTFNICSTVVLIPTREEYEKHGLASDLWWSKEDYSYFKALARLEVLGVLHKHNGNLQSAMEELYQPKTSDHHLGKSNDGEVNAAPVLVVEAVEQPVMEEVDTAEVLCKTQWNSFWNDPERADKASSVHPLALMAA